MEPAVCRHSIFIENLLDMGQNDQLDVLHIQYFVLPRNGQPIVIRIASSLARRSLGVHSRLVNWMGFDKEEDSQ